MAENKSILLADFMIDGKKSGETGLYISEMTFNEGISQIGKAVLTICSNSLCLRLRGKKDQNGNTTEEGLLDYLDKKATICFFDKKEISRTFTGKITSVTHLGVSNTVSGNIYKYEFIVESNLADMRFAHHTRQIKKSIKETLKEILSTYFGDATIDFVVAEPDTNAYLFYQQNETDYDFFMRLLAQFGLSFFVSSQKNQNSDEYYEQVTISDGKSFELPEESRQPNSHTDRNLNILVNKSSKTLSENIRIATWQMSNSISIDDICRTDSPKPQGDEKRLWFLNSMATPHSETQSDSDTRDKIAGNYLDSIHFSSANWFGTARLNDFQATDVLNIFDFYAPCDLDTEDKEKAALQSDDTIRARIISLNLVLTNILPFEVASEGSSASAEVKFRCAEISKEAPSVFTPLTDQNALSAEEPATKANLVAASIPVANEETSGVTLKKATVCYGSGEATTGEPAKNAAATINIDSQTGESYFYAKIDNSNVVSEVLFTMPFAGVGQGLYRFPRIGERILVLSNKDSRYVLHSYIPDSNTMPFFKKGVLPSDDAIEKILEKDIRYKAEYEAASKKEKENMVEDYKDELKDILANQPKEQAVATVLRHSSNNFMSDGSEVNIPNDYMTDDSLNPFTAKLKPITRNVTGSFKSSDHSTKEIKYSEIGMYSGSQKGNKWTPEVLRIQTPGNQFNHTGLANISTANSFVFSTPNANQEDSKYGSFSVLDVGSVVIDAKKSITLKVGGNMVCITEEGVSVISQTTCTNSTPYDSKLTLTPIGASLTGYTVNVASTFSTNVADGLGASMSLAKGAVAINGHSVDLATVDHQSLPFDIAFYTADLAEYLGYFADDQAEMEDRLNTGYNEMVKDGYFDSDKLSYHLGAKSDAAKKTEAIVLTIWDWIVKIVKTVYMFKSVFPPLRGKLSVYIAGVVVDIGLAIFDSVMAMIDLFGGFDSLTPEEVQRKITITNLIKIAAKTVFMYIKVHALRSYSAGDISYMMIDPNEIKTFSSSLKADFVKVDAKAHNVPLNPLIPPNNMGLAAIPDPLARAVATNLNSSVNQVVGAGSAGVFEALIATSGAVPAFALKSKMDEGPVGLDSNALMGLKASLITTLAELDVVSSTSSTVKFTSPNSEINLDSARAKIESTGLLNILSRSGTKLDCGANTIEISPASIKTTSALLDMQTTTLQMKADAALKIQGAAAQLSTQLFSISGDVANISTRLTKVG